MTTRIPTLAVIIVSWNVKTLLDRCLVSLREEIARAGVDSQVWVVDSASADETPAMLKARHPWVHLEACPQNIGFVRGNNLILKQLQSHTMPDFVWLLNPDTIVQAGTLSTLLHFMRDNPRAGLIGPTLRNPDGSLQTCAFRFPGLLQPLFDLGYLPQRFYYTRFNGRYPEAAFEKTQPFRIDHPLGAAMLARGETVNDVGFLDERFYMYCEEIDWAWRMHKAGWTVWLVPEATVTHYGGASTKQARPQATTYLWESRATLYNKHRGPLTRMLAGILVRRAFSKMKASLPTDAPEWHTAYDRIIKAWSA